jgi:ABC-type nickel/cobalt efflux system permease component RcnA
MRAGLIAFLLAMVGLAFWLWAFGGADDLARWAAEEQRQVQEGMAGYLRSLRAGEPGALAGLWGLCFAYGFFHAVGPGHGKLLIGGYGLGRRVALAKLSGLAVASSLAQAATAVVLVYAGIWAFELTRAQITDLGDEVLAPLSYGLILLLGLWLVWRGSCRLAALQRKVSYDHDHVGDARACASCGHRHAPDLTEAASVHSWRAALALVAAIAMRPCTGALFLLILTWRMGLETSGIIGAFVMGAGTATVSLVVAFSAVTFREGLLNQMSQSAASLRAVPVIEIAVGAVIALVTLNLLILTL